MPVTVMGPATTAEIVGSWTTCHSLKFRDTPRNNKQSTLGHMFT